MENKEIVFVHKFHTDSAEGEKVCHTTVLDCKKEKWQIVVNSHSDDGQPLEVCTILIASNTGVSWTGTIQDFGAIFHTLNNIISDSFGIISKECTEEVNNCLAAFNKI